MKCPKCGTENNADYVFCVNCGTSITASHGGSGQSFPTTPYLHDNESVPTAVYPGRTPPPTTNFDPLPPVKKRSIWPWLLALGVLGLIVVAGGVGVFLFVMQKGGSVGGNSTLPDHFGMFIIDQNGAKVNEIAKVESTNVLGSKDALLTDAAKSRSAGAPDVILYAEGSDIPLSDLKFVDLGSIEDNGNLRQIEFQAVPVDGKRAMKRIKFPNGVANGKYAFAVFEGSLDDGKHRLWPLQIENSTKADNADIAKTLSIELSGKTSPDANSNSNSNVNNAVLNTPTPAPKPTVTAPVGSTVAFCNSANVIVRAEPGLEAKRLTMLKKGQRVFVIRYSDNTDMWKGVESNWAYIQTESGSRGWVFTPFISK
jgi:hypothetical protein